MTEYNLSNFRMGLTGASKEDNTFLAANVSTRIELPFLRIDITSLDGSNFSSPLIRLEAHKSLLKNAVDTWSKYKAFVTDATPLDFIASILSDYEPSLATELFESKCSEFIQECFDICSSMFASLVLVPYSVNIDDLIVKHDRKELIIRGCLTDPRMTVTKYAIDRDDENVEARGDAIIRTILKSFRKAEKIREQTAVH